MPFLPMSKISAALILFFVPFLVKPINFLLKTLIEIEMEIEKKISLFSFVIF